jgi:hypothetical protein
LDISNICKVGQKIGVSLSLSLSVDMLYLRHDHPGFRTAEVGNPGGTYELPCIYHNSISLYNVHYNMFRHLYVFLNEFYICAPLSYENS